MRPLMPFASSVTLLIEKRPFAKDAFTMTTLFARAVAAIQSTCCTAQQAKRIGLSLVMCGIALSIAGCAAKNPSNPSDPYEQSNRRFFALNQALDATIVRPPTVVYTHIVPAPLRRGIHNAFNNLDEITDVSNDLLQGKIAFAVNDTWRFIINSTLGIGGLFEVAKKMHLPPHDEDFGLTLATWSKGKASPYTVMLLFGPSTYRDSFAEIFDFTLLSGWRYLPTKAWYAYVLTLWILDTRAQLLQADPLIQQAMDPYVFVRDAYLQIRRKKIEDNRIPYARYVTHYYQNGGNYFTANTTTSNDAASPAAASSHADDDFIEVDGS
jgi:phospholipid-binding lipoprotein MlaA